jgi:hypothetical protein
MAGERRGKRGWIIAGLVVVILGVGGAMLVRGFAGVHYVPITQAQIDSINGHDLKWVQPVQTNTVTAAELGELVKGVQLSEFSGYSRPIRPWAESKDRIRATSKITSNLLRLISSKELKVPDLPTDEEIAAGMYGADTFPSFAQWRILAKLIAAQIALEAEIRDGPRCFKAAMSGLAYDNFLMKSRSTGVLDYLVRVAVSAIILSAVDKAAASGAFSAEQLAVLYSTIQATPEHDEALADALRFDWSHQDLPLIQLVGRFGGDMRTLSTLVAPQDADQSYQQCGELDMPATVAQCARMLRVRIKNCSLSWGHQDVSVDREIEAIDAKLPKIPDLMGENWMKQIWEKAKYRAKMRALSNSLGLQLVSVMTGVSAAESSFRQRTTREGYRLSLLIDLYRKTHGDRLPPDIFSLKVLSGKTRFPVDLFGGGDFHYSLGRRMFWSVGKDGVDSGGKMGANRYNGPDIVFPVH